MKNLYFLFCLLPIFCFAQKNASILDHDYRRAGIASLHQTDSLFYFVEYTNLWGEMMNLVSSDLDGRFKRHTIHTSFTTPENKMISPGPDSIIVLAYNIFDYDFTFPGVIDFRFYKGVASSRFRELDVWVTDADLSADGLQLTCIHEDGKLRVYDQDDIELAEITLGAAFELEHRLVRSSDYETLFVYTKNEISILDENFELQNIYTSADNFQHVLAGPDNILFAVFEDRVESIDFITMMSDVHFEFSLPTIGEARFVKDHFVFLVEGMDYVAFSQDGFNRIDFETENLNALQFNAFSYLNENLLYNDSYSSDPIGFNGILRNQYLPSNEPSICVDLKIDDATVFNTHNVLISVDTTKSGEPYNNLDRHYEYSITVTNNGQVDVDSFNIFSNNFYSGFGPIEPFVSHKAYDLTVGQTKTITGSFVFNFYSVTVDALRFFIPGGDHKLDCFDEDNVIEVTEILSSTKDQVQLKDFTVFPNPVKDILWLSHKVNKLEVFDQFGRTILSENDCQKLDIGQLQNGVYYLKCEQGLRKFIKI